MLTFALKSGDIPVNFQGLCITPATHYKQTGSHVLKSKMKDFASEQAAKKQTWLKFMWEVVKCFDDLLLIYRLHFYLVT